MSETSMTPRGNNSSGLTSARMNRNDEFYTQLPDIEAELRHYRPHFKGKVVLCNCDDPFESNFFKYFVMNFRRLGIKKLIASCYSGSPVQGEQISLFDLEGMTDEEAEARRPYKVEITEIPDANNDGAIDLSDVEHLLTHDANVLTALNGDGDFRSRECLALLDEADIVVTNPPFSLFREYVATLIDHGKQFLILGDQNAITYPQIFTLLKHNKLWIGNDNGGTKWFRVPDDYNIATESRKKVVDGVQYFSMGRIYWFTNLDHAKRHENLILTERYTPEKYPHYDNYDAIEVSRVADIPEDWEGAMGVPITFLDKYNPDQFEILGNDDDGFPATKTYGRKVKVVDGVRSRSNTGALRCVLRAESFGPGTYFDVGYPVKGTYRRVFIRRIGATS
ncbi:adenine-specific methyltransferase EcoRI family protein [Micromonospora sp. LA-10]|uniref:adenine-specific methyltransferase EcoRI family protein n=1 Tax=Micromonospora sp. LA-10 TaxID=3446364 RepID=UPI003F72FC83